MNEKIFLAAVLREHYQRDVSLFHPISESSFEEGYLTYRIQHADGTSWLAHAYRRDRPLSDWFRYFYPWVTNDTSDWLLTRAATLACLEQQGYLSPSVVRTKTGDLIAMMDGWCILITTYIEGTVLKPTVEQLHLLGVALGRLHTLNAKQIALASPPVGKSYWYVQDVLPNALAHLASVEHLLPPTWVPLHAAFRQTLQRIQHHSELPTAIIHGDVWSANAIQTEANQVVLIDWNSGGLGCALLDLGRLLLECHLESDLPPDVPLAWHIHPDVRRITAVVDGYFQQRAPSFAELDTLLDGIRFGIAFIGALHFAQALHEGSHDQAWEDGMMRRFARLENRWVVSSEIASLAHQRFEQLLMHK